MSNVIVIDLETTGLPPLKYGKFISPEDNIEKWNNNICRIVEIAWIMYDRHGNVLKKERYIIKPDDFYVNEESTKIHGITHEQADKEGIEFGLVLSILKSDILCCETVVAHNMEFEYNVLLYEWMKEDHETIDIWKNTNKVCTMKDFLASKNIKWPKLGELYSSLCNSELVNSHSALADACACGEIYFTLIKNNYKITM